MSRSPAKLLCVVGARPNFMKIAPVMRALSNPDIRVSPMLLHTGQHYDQAMKQSFFHELDIPEPDIDLGVGSATHAVQTAEIMKRFEPVLESVKPCAVLVVGDVNSTIACALVAAKMQMPVIHVEAGLRSGDRSMPEEINRVLTDQLSNLLFTTEHEAQTNLVREGIDPGTIHFVGNVMIDTLHHNLGRAVPAGETVAALTGAAIDAGAGYGLVTLHRPSNVDNPERLKALLTTLSHISEALPLYFPVHPRTRQNISALEMSALAGNARLRFMPPLGYRQMLGMMKEARLVLTDSGGIQEETTALGVPCLTLRDSTERPITVEQGTNTVIGTDPERILAAALDTIRIGGKQGRIPDLWDGKAAERIAAVIDRWHLEVG